MKRTVYTTIILAVLIRPNPIGAAELFGIEVTYSGGTIRQSASSLPDLIEQVIRNQGSFNDLIGKDFTGSLTYYGIPDAVTVDVVGETQLTIRSSLTGLDRTFTGTDRADLQEKLTDWLLREGGTEVAKLIQEAAERSAAAITDGNPGSATAWISQIAFNTFGLYRATRPMRGSTKAGYLSIRGHARQAEAQVPVGTIEGVGYGLNIPWWIHFGRRLSLIGNISGRYADAEGTEIFGGGLDLGLGIRPAVRGQSSTFGWQVTPFAGLHAIGSYDGATAGLLDQFGIANRLEFGLFNDIILVVANQFSYHKSTKITIEDIEIDPDVAQQVVKNGLMVDIPLHLPGPMYVNGFIVDTRFLEEASVKNYQTVGAGVSIRAKGICFEAYISRDFAHDYRAWNAGAGIGLGL